VSIKHNLGVLLTAEHDGTDDLNLVQSIEEWGYESVWALEGQGKSAFGKLERWTTVTDEIGLGTGIVNVFARSPTSIAQSIATLDDHSDGRAFLGLGTAHPGVVTDFQGIEFERPLARMVEYIELIRRYLSGVAEPYDGEFYSPERTSFWELFEPIRESIPIYNGAVGEQNIRLTGEYADGWLPTFTPHTRIPEAMEWLAEGADRAGRDVDEIEVRLIVPLAVDDDIERARTAAAGMLATYLRDIPGYYDRVAKEAGFGEDVAAVKAAETTADAMDEISTEFVNETTLAATPEDARGRLRTFFDAGVDRVVVSPVSTADAASPRRMLRTLAEE